jgi:molybdopterin molybdotransferase
MIGVDEAKILVIEHSNLLAAQNVSLMDAAGLVLAEDVVSSCDIPAYPQSSMDGYAFAFDSLGAPLQLKGEQAAGEGHKFSLAPGEAARVFTGAAIPPGADTVIMQEKAVVQNSLLHADPQVVKRGDHFRPPGSEIKKGELALHKFSLLSPPAIGFLGAIGIPQVNVIPSPSISIIVTGNELLKPGEKMEYGKVFEASSFALSAALKFFGFNNVNISFVRDDLELMSSLLNEVIKHSDLVLMTGGVSVGDHDHTVDAASAVGITKIFHKVKQRPGKPLFFGTMAEKLFFGLPGNPSSVLTCFYEYVLPCLSKMTGRKLTLETIQAVLESDHRKAVGLTHFLKGVFHNEMVTISGAQESYKLNSFASANCFVVIPEDVDFVEAGSVVNIHLLPHV